MAKKKLNAPEFLRAGDDTHGILHLDIGKRGQVKGVRAYETILGFFFEGGGLRAVLTVDGVLPAEGLAIIGPAGEVTRDGQLYADEDTFVAEAKASLQ